MNNKIAQSPISFCTLQRPNRKLLVPYKLKLNTDKVTNQLISLCPEFKVMEKYKLELMNKKTTIYTNNETKKRIRLFKKMMIKSSSDAMLLGLMMKDKKFKKSCLKQKKKELTNSQSCQNITEKPPVQRSRNKEQIFLTNLKPVKQVTTFSDTNSNFMYLSTNRYTRDKFNCEDLIPTNKFIRTTRSPYYPRSNRSQSSKGSIGSPRFKQRTLSNREEKIEKVTSPTLMRLYDIKNEIIKQSVLPGMESLKDIKRKRIFSEMKEIEMCID